MNKYSIKIAKKVEELRHSLESKTVECPSEEHIHPGPNALETCITGRIPNPIYVPLLNVVRDKCFSCRGNGKDIHCSCDYAPCLHSELACPACGGGGYITRSWDDLPKGALAGALLHALLLTPRIAISGQKYLEIITAPFDPDQAAVQAVLTILEALA